MTGDTITFKAKLTPPVTLDNSDYVWSGAQSGNGPTISINFANAFNYAEGLSVMGCPNLVAGVTAMDVPLPNQAIWAILNPIAATAAYNLAAEAQNWAAANWNALGGSSAVWNCRADAARHSYWNLIMSLDPDMDLSHAEGAATAHERTNLESTPNRHNEIVMDLQNNAVGRSLSSGFMSSTPRATLQAAIVSALNAGNLTILDDFNNANEVGLLKPSNQ
ncbi:MAG: hypothetical protein GX548_08240 [Lentisphaerae bacterium]|nr:hypothetical protein [Lentisphaerota bacterium]